MTIEHLVSGIPDSTLMYDVLSKKPPMVEAALGPISLRLLTFECLTICDHIKCEWIVMNTQ